jgi:hypothetical protein
VKLHQDCSLTAASPGEGQGSIFKVGIPIVEMPPGAEASSRRVLPPGSQRVEGVRSESERDEKSQSTRHRRLNILVVVSELVSAHCSYP